MDWSEEGYLALSALNVKDGYIDFSQDVHYGNQELYDKWMTGNELHKGQVLFTTEAPMGNVAQVPDNRQYILSQRTIAFDVEDDIITENFLATVLRTPTVFADLTALSSGGTAKGVSQKSLASVEIRLPKDLKEQERIADTFSNLDNLITLHQRKDEFLFIRKICIMQKQKTITWEQRKVGEFYDFKNGLNKGKEFFGEGTPIVNFTDVFHNRGIYAENLKGKVSLEPSEIKNYEVKKGDIFFTRTSETIEEIGYPSVMLDTAENTVFSGFVLRGRCNQSEDPLDDLFKKYVFFTDTFRVEMLKKSSMTTRALTSGTAIKNMVFQFPSSKEEQHKIGEYLTNLDRLITLHQRKPFLLKCGGKLYARRN